MLKGEPETNPALPAFLAGGGETGRLIARFDWAATSLGRIESWPQSLKSATALLLRSAVPMVMLWGEAGYMLYNDAYSVFAGGRHPRLLGSKVREGWPEVADFNDNVMKVGLAGGTLAYKDQELTLYRHGRPEQVWMNLDYSPVLDESGNPAGVLAIVVETTERVAAERRIRDSNERFRAFVTASSSSLYRMSPDWTEMRQLDGHGFLSDTQTPSRDWLEAYIHPEDQAHVTAAIATAIRSKTTFELEHRVRLADGSLGWTHSRAVPIFNETGHIVEWFGAASDVTARKQAEARVRASEARYHTLFEAIDAGFCVVEVMFDQDQRPLDYRFLEANPAFEKQTGLSSAVGRSARELVPGLEDHWFEAYGRVALTGEPVRFENGSEAMGRWFDVHALRVGPPEARRVAILFNDISERRRAEARLRELNESLETAVAERTAERDRVWRLARELMCVARTDGTLLSVNPAWERVLGWSAEELIGRRAAEIKHPDDAERTAAELGRLAEGHPTLAFEDRYRHKDGGWSWISWTAEPEGELIYCVGRDVTAEKEAREALEQAEAARREADALYRAYFENTPEALFVIRVEREGFVVEEVNPAHEAGVGFKIDDIRNKRPEEFLPAAIADRVIESYQRVLETGDLHQYREVFDLNGDPQHWDTSLVPVREPDGRITRLIGSSRNVTRQVVAEEALRQSQKMEAMGQLTGGVAHDFNNLLTPIVGSLDMLQRKGVGGEREQRLIAGAMQSAERAKTLVQRLLAFARRQPLQPVPVDVAKLVTGMGELVASTTGPQIKVVVEAPDDLPPALADPNQVEMALLNLAVNARDAMPDGGTLRITASAETMKGGQNPKLKPGGYVRLSVADTGTGMDETTLARAVEPFFSTKGVGKGTGLGLSMVHGLASQLGGALTLRSRLGLGTNVELWLPQSARAPEAAESAPVTPAPSPARGTALLVDDEELVRLSTADMLHDLGFQVIEAASAEEALRLVDDGGERFDLLVTDHLMPGMSGTELARRLRAARPDMSVVVVSGYAEGEGIEPDLPRLTKPFRKDELAATLAQVATGP